MHSAFRISLLLVLFCGLCPLSEVDAVEHEQCHNCGKFVVVSQQGAGLRRHASGAICCRGCMRADLDGDEFDSVEEFILHNFRNRGELGEHRYIIF
jgi:hypothetical protein